MECRDIGRSTADATFWSKVAKSEPDACWEWTGPRTGAGYGKTARSGKYYQAHRLAYEIEYGPFNPDLHVLHTCDSPACCNPAHLRLGTHADNMRDRRSRHREARGEGNGKHRLTDDDVREIRDLYSTGEWTVAELGKRFQVLGPTIHAVVVGKTWTHI